MKCKIIDKNEEKLRDSFLTWRKNGEVGKLNEKWKLGGSLTKGRKLLNILLWRKEKRKLELTYLGKERKSELIPLWREDKTGKRKMNAKWKYWIILYKENVRNKTFKLKIFLNVKKILLLLLSYSLFITDNQATGLHFLW